MLIKKIELQNFRPYVGKQTISFSTDEEKNITIVMGDNGSGKTTLAQAFLWVLYGDTDFKVKELINRVVRDEMKPNEKKKVKVDLYLTHEDRDYIISRAQTYKRNYTTVKAENVEFSISYNKDGQQEFLKPHERDIMIKKMLPHQLSKFFFFDGERIKNMSEEIEKGKSREFADAVRGLVGLTAIMNAINHLKPSTTNSTVIGRYNRKIDEGGNAKIAELSDRINSLQQKYESLEKRIEELKDQIEYYRKDSEQLKLRIASYAPAEKMQKEYNKLKDEVAKLEKVKVDAVKTFLNYFNKNTPSFLAKPLIHTSLKDLAEADKLDKGIPDMHANTIDFLIKRGFCVCGTKLEPGSDAYSEICKALEFLPPKSIGVLINQFVRESQDRTRLSETYFEVFENSFRRIREIKDQISERQAELTNLDNKLLDVSEVASLKKRQLDSEQKEKEFNEELREKILALGATKSKIESLSKERDQLILVDERNKEYELFRQYAITVYEELKNSYDLQEEKTRQKLEDYINEIFTDIFSDALSIKVDKRYNIKVSVKDRSFEGNELEYSTAQNYSIIFAFIAGIIKMAKEAGKNESSSEDDYNVFVEAEGYPLVMDAPLSSFDKTRIKNICNTLPKIARQVIFFIKDTDGEVAEEHLGDKIGAKYLINIDKSFLLAEIKER
ncbi:MAG: sulfur modification protein DndD [Clostridia bacterium]|jgi:DNA sulfur modification protein DndD|nr:sulfur modification protein DndD [Clostridia bacterium]